LHGALVGDNPSKFTVMLHSTVWTNVQGRLLTVL